MMFEEDEDYLDDPIKLIDFEQDGFRCYWEDTIIIDNDEDCSDKVDGGDDDNYYHTYGQGCQKQFDKYISMIQKNTSQLPSSFTEIKRNVELLNECRPISIKVVDCHKFPSYTRFINEKISNDYEDIINEMFKLPELSVVQDNNCCCQSEIDDIVNECDTKIPKTRLIQTENDIEYQNTLSKDEIINLTTHYFASEKQYYKSADVENKTDPVLEIKPQITQAHSTKLETTYLKLKTSSKPSFRREANIDLSDKLMQSKDKLMHSVFHNNTTNAYLKNNAIDVENQNHHSKKKNHFIREDLLYFENGKKKYDNMTTYFTNKTKMQTTKKKEKNNIKLDLKINNNQITGRTKKPNSSHGRKEGYKSVCPKNIFSSNRIIPHFHHCSSNIEECVPDKINSVNCKPMNDLHNKIDESGFLFQDTQNSELHFSRPINKEAMNSMTPKSPSQRINKNINYIFGNVRKQADCDLNLCVHDTSTSLCDDINMDYQTSVINNALDLTKRSLFKSQFTNQNKRNSSADPLMRFLNQDDSARKNKHDYSIILDKRPQYCNVNRDEYSSVYPKISSVYSLKKYSNSHKQPNTNSFFNSYSYNQNFINSVHRYNYSNTISNSGLHIPSATIVNPHQDIPQKFVSQNKKWFPNQSDVNICSTNLSPDDEILCKITKKSSEVLNLQKYDRQFIECKKYDHELGARSSLNGLSLSSIRPATKTLQVGNDNPILRRFIESKSRSPVMKNGSLTSNHAFESTQLNRANNFFTSNGYSPPVLPIPTYQKAFDVLENMNTVCTDFYKIASFERPDQNIIRSVKTNKK